jgi:hypothetical protein
MARRDTIHEERWRVQVVRTTERGTYVTREENFRGIEEAVAYWEALYLPGQEKLLQVRPAGASRFGVVRQAFMRDDERQAS